VPTSLRGFEERHDRRLLTVFTASNYCGMAGNYGAIVVFDSDMSYTLEEHMAPDLDTMILEYNKTAKPPPQAPKALTKTASITKRTRETTSNLAQSRDKMNEEVLAKLEQKICQHKDELWWFWKESDVDDTGCIPVGRWRQGMSTMLHLDIPWHSLEDELARPDADGIVDYRDFLHRIRNNAMAQAPPPPLVSCRLQPPLRPCAPAPRDLCAPRTFPLSAPCPLPPCIPLLPPRRLPALCLW
jgi:hypothetical protein